MPRPKRCRRICGYPDFWSFAAEEAQSFETVVMTLDELETIRLIDDQKLTQEECAERMQVSRATVAAIYERARYKTAQMLVYGKRIQIAGGSYQMDQGPFLIKVKEKGENTMRIAVTYDNGNVGQHFGRTAQFCLYDVTDGTIAETQIIDTNGTGHGALAGFLKAAKADRLICEGIGQGARMALQEAGIELIPGVQGNCDEAVKAYLAGTLSFDPDETCHHHDHEHEEGHECHYEHGCGSHGCH